MPSRPLYPFAVLLLVLALPLAPARAEPPEPRAELHGAPELVGQVEPLVEPSFEPNVPRALVAGAGSLVPGLLLHGAGPFLAGDSDGAVKLLAVEGAAVGLTALGFVPIALTGASRYPIAPLYAFAGMGIGMFSISALANVYSAATLAIEPGVPLARLPAVELDFGYQAVSDPVFAYNHFAAIGASGWIRNVRLGGAGYFAVDDDNQRGRVTGAWRFFGPTGSTERGDGTYLELELGLGHHRYGTERFNASSSDLLLRGRYALRRLSHRMRGAFGELGLGYGVQAIRYQNGEIDLPDMLLMELGFGVNLGRVGPMRGEAMVFYDHRRDSFARALKASSGIVGSFGLRSRLYLTERWGLAAEAAMGTAYVGRLSAIYHFGGQQ